MIRVNLLKPEKKDFKEEAHISKAKTKKKIDYQKASILLTILLMVFLFFTQKSSLRREKGLYKMAQDEKQRLLYVFSKLEELELQKSLYEKKINLIKQLKSTQDVAVKVMDGLSENIPTWVWLTQSTFDNNTVHIKGRAFSNSAVADYISKLEINPFFDEVNLIASVQKKVKEIDINEFALTARYTLGRNTPPQEESKDKSVKGK